MIPDIQSELAFIRRMTDVCGQWVLPLVRADADGSIRLLSLSDGVAPSRDDLEGYRIPTVAILPAPHLAPEDCAALPILRRSVQMVLVMTAAPTERELEMVIEIALSVGNIVLIGASGANAAAWSRAFLPRAAGMVLGGVDR